MKRRARAVVALALVFAAVLAAPRAHAQQPPPSPSRLPTRQAVIGRQPDNAGLHASFSFRDVVDARVRRKLQSGLPTVIVMGGAVFTAGSDTPAEGTGFWQSCRIAFDVWNEVYRIQVPRPAGPNNAVAVNLEGVLRRCAEARAPPISGWKAPAGSYYLAATVEANPASQDMIDKIHRWVSRPPGSSAVTPGDSIFSSFVGLFVARSGKADRSLAFRSQTFSPPP